MSEIRKLRITELNRLSQQEFQQVEKTPLVVVLDNVRSLHNIGSIFRTADAFLLEAVYLCGICSVPPHPEIHKTALGAEDSVPWKYFGHTTDAVEKLKSEGYQVFAVEQASGSILIQKLQINKGVKTAIILGHEVKGVQQEVIDICDACIEIPQYGTKHSLNVSVAGGILIWEIFSKLTYGLER